MTAVLINSKIQASHEARLYLMVNDGLKKSRSMCGLWIYPVSTSIKARRKMLYQGFALDKCLAQLAKYQNNTEIMETV